MVSLYVGTVRLFAPVSIVSEKQNPEDRLSRGTPLHLCDSVRGIFSSDSGGERRLARQSSLPGTDGNMQGHESGMRPDCAESERQHGQFAGGVIGSFPI